MKRFILLSSFVFLSPTDAFAYVDPGTGGLLYQVLILFAGVVAGYFAFFKRFLKSLFSRKDHSEHPKDS